MTDIQAALAAGKMVMVSGPGARKLAQTLGATPAVAVASSIMLDEQMPASLPALPVWCPIPEGVLLTASNNEI